MSLEAIERRVDLFQEAGPAPDRLGVFWNGKQVRIGGRQEWSTKQAALVAVHARLSKVWFMDEVKKRSQKPDRDLRRAFIERNIEIKPL
jgi:hypothetical protein